MYYSDDLSAVPATVQQPTADVLHVVTERFLIDDSRAVQQAAESRPVVAEYKEVVVCFPAATIEAQNALLKILEEPPATARFHIVVPGPAVLLDTVRSRLAEVATAKTSSATTWSALAAMPIATQLAEIANRSKAKDVSWQTATLQAAVHDQSVPSQTRVLLDSAMRSPGASKKMLLEELVLAVANH